MGRGGGKVDVLSTDVLRERNIGRVCHRQYGGNQAVVLWKIRPQRNSGVKIPFAELYDSRVEMKSFIPDNIKGFSNTRGFSS